MKDLRGIRYRKIRSALVALTFSSFQVSCSDQRSYPSYAELNARALGLSRNGSSSTSDDYRYRRGTSKKPSKQHYYETSNQAYVHNEPYHHSTEGNHVNPEDSSIENSANLSISNIVLPDSSEGGEQFDQSYDANDEEFNLPNPATEGHRGNPVIYRYFGRSRARSAKSESIPFIVLGPKVDHWKSVGRILASRGFNVMACEQVLTENSNGNNGYYGGDENLTATDEYQRQVDDSSDGEALIIAVLDALKWNKAVLVGCDRDAVLAIEAALRLAPERIAGLVLCGDLTYVEDHIGKQILSMQQSGDFDDEENLTIGSFLRDYVDCPCTVISDGDAFLWPTDSYEGAAAISMNEKIIGGGLSPHRQLPEQFAWTLSRFVENKVSEQPPPNKFELNLLRNDGNYQRGEKRVEFRGGSTVTMQEETRQRNIWQDKLPPEIEQMLGNIFSSGSLLVSGRAIASAVIYISLAKVGLVQYKNIRNIHLSYLPFSVKKLKNLSREIFRISLPIVMSRDRKRIPNVSDSDVCDSEVTVDGSELDVDSLPSAAEHDVISPELCNPDCDSFKNGLDENRKYETEMDTPYRPHLNFFTLDQVVS